jgi:hypothetical protein
VGVGYSSRRQKLDTPGTLAHTYACARILMRIRHTRDARLRAGIGRGTFAQFSRTPRLTPWRAAKTALSESWRVWLAFPAAPQPRLCASPQANQRRNEGVRAHFCPTSPNRPGKSAPIRGANPRRTSSESAFSRPKLGETRRNREPLIFGTPRASWIFAANPRGPHYGGQSHKH